MIAYLDTSAIVKLFLVEDGSELVRELWEGDTPVSTAGISQTELVCALAAAARDGRFGAGQLSEDVIDGTFLREHAEVVAADAGLLVSASRLAVAHRLRAVDAIHVASVLVLRDTEPIFVSWDDEQRNAAHAEGLPLYPPAVTA